MNLLFWNLKGNSIEEHIINCLNENDIDIAVFSEYKGIDFNLVESNSSYKQIIGFDGCDKITMIAKQSISITVKQEQSRYSIYSVLYNDTEYLIAGIHLQDRRSYPDPAIRIMTIQRLVNDIEKIERNISNNNTIVIGDFNANPYDPELLQMNAFNAVLFKDLIEQSATNVVAGIRYKRFYNPILNYISESTKTYGSFRYSGGCSNPIWHCLDQIIVRKPLANSIIDLEYIKSINGKSLIKRTNINSDISDHLPLFVKFI